jgi:hypothetical protein
MQMETHDVYHQQRIDGARQLIEKANKLAKIRGIVLDRCEWDHGQPIVSRAKHILSVLSSGKTTTGEFPDDWLADYPGRVGIEKANAVLSEMIRRLGE